jgi:ligand-binding sensor domain-containing protein
MYQDKQGYIWFANDKGLSRFNGYEFENFDMEDGLTGNVILKFYPQENGQIWCYTLHNQSLFYFDEVFQSFHKYKYNNILQKELGQLGIVKSIWISKDKSIHLGGFSINGELIIEEDGTVRREHASSNYNPKSVVSILKENANAGILPFLYASNKVEGSFYTDYKGAHLMGCWLLNNQKAVLHDGEFIRIKEKGKEDIVIPSAYQTIRIKKIDQKHFFVGYKFGGGAILNDRGEVVTTFLKNKSVSDILVDHHGGYWFTTLNSGVYYVKSPSIKYVPTQNVSNPNIRTLTSDGVSLFVGFEDGTLGKVSHNKTFEEIQTSQKTSPAFVEYDRQYQKLLYYNDGALYDLSTQKSLFQKHSLNISPPKNESLLVSTPFGFHAVNYTGRQQAFASPYRVLDVAFWRNHYYTATPRGVFKYEEDTIVSLASTAEQFAHRADDIDVSPNETRLFLATQGAGMLVYEDNIKSITTKNGLYSNSVNEIHVENDSVVWVCTNKGLNQVLLKGDEVFVKGIDKEIGLLSNEIKDVEIIGNTVWVGTNEGLCFFPKSLLEQVSNHQSFLEIKEIQANGLRKETSHKMVFSYDQNTIDFVVQEISFTHQKNIQYQYRLLGLHDDWKTSTSRTIRFSPLPHGEYTFEVKSCIQGDCFEKIVQQRFVIAPPFWNAWWFYLLCILAVGGIVYLFFKIRVLTYNKDLTREFIRLLVRRLKKKENFLSLRELGNDVKIKSNDILYVKSANNYVNIVTEIKTYTVRMGIGKFLDRMPDRLEYVRIHRSYIVRLDKITAKSKNEIFIQDVKIPVGSSYLQNLKKIHF